MPSPSSADVLVDAHDRAPPAVDLALEVERRTRDLALRIALLHGLHDPAHRVDLVDVLPRRGLDLIGQRLDEVAAGQRVGDVGDAGLLEDQLLRAQRELRRVLGRQRVGLVVAVRVQRLRATEHGGERLHRRAHDGVERLLRHQRNAGGLRVGAQQPRPRVLRAEPLAHQLRPHPPAGAELGDLLEEVVVHVEEERQARRELVDVEPGLDAELHVADPVGERERELLHRRRPRLADVVAADRDGVPRRHVPRAPHQHVADDAHVAADRRDPLLLRDELLEHVVLQRPAQRRRRHALALRHRDVEREQHRRRRVDRHRRRHLVERDIAEQARHVVERRDADALAADLAERARVVRVVAHERRHVERRRQPGLPRREQELEAPVRVLGRAEAGEHAHRPRLAAIHRLVRTARVRIAARGRRAAPRRSSRAP